MKVVIQRVSQASVKVNSEIISSIAQGLLAFVGLSENDTKEDLDFIARKLLNVKFFDDNNGKTWSKSVMDKNYEILCVSQFTLCYSLKGNKLDFHHAMKKENSQQFYESFLECLRKQYKSELIKDGKFGAHMEVELCNNGPVTITLESVSEKTKAYDHSR